MAHDYEDINNIEGMDDVELRDLVREQLAGHGALDIDDITVTATDGLVALSGRVGTDGERRIAEHIITDVLGIQDLRNDLVVDSLRRGESPMAIDEQLADEASRAGTLLGDVEVPLPNESALLADAYQEDLDGTTDYTQVMEDGATWNPPSSPTPEGMNAEPGELGENH